MTIKKILTGVDFGKDTDRVLTYASLFARQFGSALGLLYVIDYLVTPRAYIAPYIEQEKNEALGKFEAIRDRLAGKGVEADTEVIVGRLQESFVSAVDRMSADLLVLGFVSHAFRRSSAEKLIKGLKMPMLVVRGRKAEAALDGSPKISRILCPFDYSEASEKALRVAAELRELFSAELYALHIVPEITRDENIENEDSYSKRLDKLRKDNMSSMLKILGDKGVKAESLIDSGVPAERIAAISDEMDIDLIVIGARGLGLIKGMLIGSVTDAVLKSSPCPVFVVH